MADLYLFVHPAIGNDSYDGDSFLAGHPKKTLQGAINAVTNPTTGSPILNVKTKIYLWNDTSGYTDDVEINGIVCLGKDVNISIQPFDWDEPKYLGAVDDPFGGSGGWGIAYAKPVKIDARIQIKSSSGIEFRGICFGSNGENAGLEVMMGSAYLRYCSFEGKKAGIISWMNSSVIAENCNYDGNNVPIQCRANSLFTLAGENQIKNPIYRGIVVSLNSAVWFFPWMELAHTKFLTTFLTDQATFGKFAMIEASVRSSVFVQTPIAPEMAGGQTAMAKVKILNSYETLAPDYFCVILDSGSQLTGFSNMSFQMKNLKGDTVGMPLAQRVSSAVGEGTVVTD
jgi:hypothetical protein